IPSWWATQPCSCRPAIPARSPTSWNRCSCVQGCVLNSRARRGPRRRATPGTPPPRRSPSSPSASAERTGHASCFVGRARNSRSSSGGEHAMANQEILTCAAVGVVSQDTSSRDTMSQDGVWDASPPGGGIAADRSRAGRQRGVTERAQREAGRLGTTFASATLLCSAALGAVLAAGPAGAAAPPPPQFIPPHNDQGGFGQVTDGINVGDIDGDGRPDIVVGGDNYLVWFHNPDWAPHLIASGFKFAGGAMVVVRDIDGDGRLDVMTGKYPLGHEEQRQTVWFGNTPSGWA